MEGNNCPDVTFDQISTVLNGLGSRHKWTEGMADHKSFAFSSNVDEARNIDPGLGYKMIHFTLVYVGLCHNCSWRSLSRCINYKLMDHSHLYSSLMQHTS
jgi:hypothetical protein